VPATIRRLAFVRAGPSRLCADRLWGRMRRRSAAELEVKPWCKSLPVGACKPVCGAGETVRLTHACLNNPRTPEQVEAERSAAAQFAAWHTMQHDSRGNLYIEGRPAKEFFNPPPPSVGSVLKIGEQWKKGSYAVASLSPGRPSARLGIVAGSDVWLANSGDCEICVFGYSAPESQRKKQRGADGDEEAQSAAACHYCLSEEGELVSPCCCRGTAAFVHLDCLRQMHRSRDPMVTGCPECKSEFVTFASLELAQLTVERLEQSGAAESRDYGIALLMEASCRLDIGDLQGAQPLLLRASSALYGDYSEDPDPADLLGLRKSMTDYQLLMGWHTSAKERYERDLHSWEEHFGKGGKGSLPFLEGLGHAHTALGDLRAAEGVREQIVAIAKRECGVRHLGYAFALRDYADSVSQSFGVAPEVAAVRRVRKLLETSVSVLEPRYGSRVVAASKRRIREFARYEARMEGGDGSPRGALSLGSPS
jgi:hypothetical protein